MLTIRLLGNPTFTLHNQSITHLVVGRTGALLAYLAVTGQSQPRALLTDLLWENIPEQQARTNLRYLLSNLRKVVGDYVVGQGESVTFNQELPLEVAGLTPADGVTLLAAQRLTGDPTTLQYLHQHYAGNPRMLSQAANLIDELFRGDVAAFLREELFFLGDIGAALTQQLAHLTPLAQQVLHGLAQAGRPLCRQTLYEQLTPLPAKRDYFQALQHLQRAFLLQQTASHIELPALLVTYLAEHTLPT